MLARIAATSVERRLAAVLMALGSACAIATCYALFHSWNSQVVAERVTTYLLTTDVAITLVLAGIVIRRLFMLWLSRRRGQTGAKLHARLVMLFALIAVIPTVVVSTFSTAFLNRGLDSWFSQRIQDAVGSSVIMVESYQAEERSQVRREATEIVRVLQNSGVLESGDQAALNNVIGREVWNRNLTQALIITRLGQVKAGGGRFGPNLLQRSDLSATIFDKADLGAVEVDHTQSGTRALVALGPASGLYLYVGKAFDPRISIAIEQNRNAVQLYHQIENARSKLQITVGLIFAVLALLVLTAAIWVAIVYATQLVKPISRLASAAEQIGGGDLSARVKIGLAEDDLSALSRTFNVMAIQLQSQQHALIAANRQSDERRRFTELVLSGVSAGVIGLADDGTINLPNRSASELLGVNLQNLIGQPLAVISPEMAEIVEKARSRNSGTADGQILFSHGTVTRTFHVRVVSEAEEEGRTKLVVTFDDVSELLSAQRKAAWSDIARRIAHEIKNPLTPIQLSAERLKRKYLRQITDDPDTFTACTDTIVRQVGDIGRMVDEFSAFARMPAPALRPEDAAELAKQAAFLQQNAHPAIHYRLDIPTAPVELVCDASQFNRAITNLMKNAAESIGDRLEEQASRGDTDLTPGEIHLWMKPMHDRLLIGIDDNGRGLPEHNRDRLTEPYVTTRSKGTGLGLAIVKKILEDHGGTLSLSDRDGGGASVLVTFPLDAAAANVADSGRAHAAAGTA
ncbi:sensor histidine kinase NtrY-like [Dongia sedimenti]|uniref:Nitrogen regulation protein n=1 Tax=Dongia sedimenti TaxID=3064282 RepID=A0ABU0YJX2_9PROT|nr:PAS domain-containing sensor histidine kinase [Rhodospirillaceae bacterium R-7]